MGGDIVKSKYLSITITILGVIDKGKYIKRNSAKINDDIWVTGNIGDSYIGHKLLKKRIIIKNINKKKYFINSYYYPNPPVALSIKLGKFMTSAIDISDGFIGDLEKITVNFKKGTGLLTANRCLFQNSQLHLGADITVNFEIEQYSKSDPFFNILDDIWVEISLRMLKYTAVTS